MPNSYHIEGPSIQADITSCEACAENPDTCLLAQYVRVLAQLPDTNVRALFFGEPLTTSQTIIEHYSKSGDGREQLIVSCREKPEFHIGDCTCSQFR